MSSSLDESKNSPTTKSENSATNTIGIHLYSWRVNLRNDGPMEKYLDGEIKTQKKNLK